jgi:hypothetical protein
MTRKDYRLIAEAIRKAQERFYQREEENPYALVDMIIDDLSDSLKQDNIRFDRVRFYKASKLH